MKNPRSVLTIAFKRAWESTISKYYNVDGPSPAINSEAALQAYFLVELTEAVHTMEIDGDMPSGTRVFIEPTIYPRKIIPDMIVCRNKSVIAVVELKYFPRVDMAESEKNAISGVEKDLDSFERVYEMTQADTETSPSFIHERYLGEFSEKSEKFEFSRKTLFIWGGVHKASSNSLKEKFPSHAVLQGMPMFEMHANTRDDGKADPSYFFDGMKTDAV